MLIPKGEVLELGRRGNFRDILRELSEGRFSGYVEVSYKKGELSRARVLFSNGKIVAAGVQRVISKSKISGEKALEELLTLENCVADVYILDEEKIAKALEWNRNAVVEHLPETEVKVEGGLTEEVITTPEERDAILKKYGIRLPSEEEIDQIIANALDGSYDIYTAIKPGDFDSLKKSLVSTAELYLGKMSKKVADVINDCKSAEELVERFDEIRSAAKSLVIFVSRKKIDEMLSEMEKLIGEGI
uniref:DUF2226 domain-containing protein n=1 Tax=Archaeoglobus fulgidus TaxID=2234 RepID=A0A7C3ZET3_ARCFL